MDKHQVTRKPDRIIPEPQTRERLGGISRTTLWRMTRAGIFPRPMRISPGRIGWRESTIEEYLEAREREAARFSVPGPDDG